MKTQTGQDKLKVIKLEFEPRQSGIPAQVRNHKARQVYLEK